MFACMRVCVCVCACVWLCRCVVCVVCLCVFMCMCVHTHQHVHCSITPAVYVNTLEVKVCHARNKVLATLRRLRYDYEVCMYVLLVSNVYIYLHTNSLYVCVSIVIITITSFFILKKAVLILSYSTVRMNPVFVHI